MKQKLYYVEVQKQNYAIVAALSAAEAERVAANEEDEILAESEMICDASEVKEPIGIPHEWLDDIPYNSDNELTCREMVETLERNKIIEKRDRAQLKFEFHND